MKRNYILDVEGIDRFTQERFRRDWYIRSRDAVTAKQSVEYVGRFLKIHYIIHSVKLNQVLHRKTTNGK